MNIYTKMGKFEIGGIANGGGHSCAINEPKGVAIPPRRQPLIQIDMNKLAQLNAWHTELLTKFAEASNG